MISNASRFFFFVLLMIAVAVPAQAQLRCKAKQNKKTGDIVYSFTSRGGGAVQWSYVDLGIPSSHNEPDLPYDFANSDTCQAGGRGRNCVVSVDPDRVKTAPSTCTIFMYDALANTTCELYVPGCQRAERPAPASGVYPVRNEHGTVACWDARNDIEWHISPAHVPRSLDGQEAHLRELNGEAIDEQSICVTPTGANCTLLGKARKVRIPTLPALSLLAQECVEPQQGNSPCRNALCASLWNTTGDCVWSSSEEVSANGQAWAVCLQSDAANGTDQVVATLKSRTDLGISVFENPFHEHDLVDSGDSDAYNHAVE
jgi:hypothetical protein